MSVCHDSVKICKIHLGELSRNLSKISKHQGINKPISGRRGAGVLASHQPSGRRTHAYTGTGIPGNTIAAYGQEQGLGSGVAQRQQATGGRLGGRVRSCR